MTLQPHLKELVHPRNLKTRSRLAFQLKPAPNDTSDYLFLFVLESPAFLELSDTSKVRFQDVFLKF